MLYVWLVIVRFIFYCSKTISKVNDLIEDISGYFKFGKAWNKHGKIFIFYCCKIIGKVTDLIQDTVPLVDTSVLN